MRPCGRGGWDGVGHRGGLGPSQLPNPSPEAGSTAEAACGPRWTQVDGPCLALPWRRAEEGPKTLDPWNSQVKQSLGHWPPRCSAERISCCGLATLSRARLSPPVFRPLYFC